MNKLQEMVQKYPQTEVWNDSCSCSELQYAIERGASGATTNPVIVGNVLKKELKDWEGFIQTSADQATTGTEDDVAWTVIKAMGEKASKLLLPQFESSKGQKGRISFQTNAKYYRNKDLMVKQAEELAAVCPNSQVKLPASKAGIEAFEELTYRGVSINATVSFTVAQAIAVAQAVEKGLKRREAEGKDTSTMHPVCTIMAGRVDDYLKEYVKQNQLLVPAEALEMAGVAVVKNAYKIYQKEKYRTKLLVAAFRNQAHWEEFIGGDIVLTIPYGWQVRYNNSPVQVQAHMDEDVDPKLLASLQTLEDFRKAYEPDGMKPEEFEHYGAFVKTMNQFLNGYDSLVQLVRTYMVK